MAQNYAKRSKEKKRKKEGDYHDFLHKKKGTTIQLFPLSLLIS
jgi:hypothetical protein